MALSLYMHANMLSDSFLCVCARACACVLVHARTYLIGQCFANMEYVSCALSSVSVCMRCMTICDVCAKMCKCARLWLIAAAVCEKCEDCIVSKRHASLC